jgi:thioredoxin-like negative regulator of GroEL
MNPALALPLLLVGATVQVPHPPVAIHWERNFDQALKMARKQGKPLFVDFWADWCAWCRRLDRTTYADPDVIKLAQDFVPVKVNTEGSGRELAVTRRYEVTSLPTIVFVSPEGRQILRLNGFLGPGQFPQTMEAALETAGRVMAFEQALAQNPDDASALTGLGIHLYEQQEFGEAREMLEKAVARDADLPLRERRRSRMLLAILQHIEHNFAEAERLVKEALALQPSDEDEPKLLFVLGRTYVSWGRTQEGAATLEVIVRQYPKSPLAQRARETLISLGQK